MSRQAKLVVLASIVVAAALPAWGAERAAWDFASAASPWRPRDKSIALERVECEGPDGNRIAALRIHGRIEIGYNYAQSELVPVTASQAYRLTARLRVDRLGPATPPPYLKCEFQGEKPRQVLGQVHSESYSRSQMGKWQKLEAEFLAPPVARRCLVALEKGTPQTAEIDACLADVRLEPIPRLTALEQYRLDPIPATLEKMRGVHPRLYLTGARIAELRAAIQTTHAGIWKKIRDLADLAVRRGPPKYILHDSSGDEQLWQRSVGSTMPTLAMAYLLTGQRQYLAAAEQWALASCRYRTWGLGRRDGLDLAAGHQLFGLALVYDWCYHDLGAAARRQIRATLASRAAAMFQGAATGKVGWYRAYLQNHLWVSAAGLAAAGFALFDEVPEAAEWIGLPLDKFRRTMDALGPDGASHEGVGYWEYGVEYMLKFMDLAERLLGFDLYQAPWWRNTASYAQYLTLPQGAWQPKQCIVDLADCPRYHWYGPDYLLRGLARRFQDPYAQGLADELDRAGVCAPGAPWLNLLWYDPSLRGKPPGDLPTLHHFDDLGIVSARSGWSGGESLVVLKCGPCLGHAASKKFSYDPGSGHAHPDANHFLLFGAGQWLVRDDGYRPKWTGQHNTLLVDDKGQLGEGAMWFQGSVTLGTNAPPRVLAAESTPEVDRLVGDATGAYPAGLGLTRFVRRLLFLKPDVLIVADDVKLEHESALELRFHPEQEARREGSVFLAPGKQATLRIEPLTPEGVEVSGETMPMPGGDGRKESSLFAIRLRTRRAAWRNAVALSWSPAVATPVQVELHTEGGRWLFTAGNRKVALDWDR